MRITALKPQARHPERVNLFLDGEFRCGLALELVHGAGLRVGQTLDEARLTEIVRADLRWKARDAAFRLIAHRPRTAAELRQRLARKEFPPDVVEACVADLSEKGFVDDVAFAEAFVRDRVRLRPRGRRRLVHELRGRGVADEAASDAVQRVFEDADVSEHELARTAASGWIRRNGPSTPGGRGSRDAWAARRRLYAFLARRGFDLDVIRAVLDETVPAPS